MERKKRALSQPLALLRLQGKPWNRLHSSFAHDFLYELLDFHLRSRRSDRGISAYERDFGAVVACHEEFLFDIEAPPVFVRFSWLLVVAHMARVESDGYAAGF